MVKKTPFKSHAKSQSKTHAPKKPGKAKSYGEKPFREKPFREKPYGKKSYEKKASEKKVPRAEPAVAAEPADELGGEFASPVQGEVLAAGGVAVAAPAATAAPPADLATAIEDGEAAPATTSPFADLGLDARLLKALKNLGYEEPTPIQQQTIPPLLAGVDMIGQAATGTGKTAAFALPLLQRLAAVSHRTSPSALILTPTRELAMQVAEAVHKYGRSLGASVLPIYGGQPFGPQLKALERGVDVVVATPGRALDHLRRGTLRIDQLQVVVLDEADEMLDMGFAEDIEAILQETPPGRQTVLFSATLPAPIAAIARRHLTDPTHIKVIPEPVARGAMPKIQQRAYVVQRAYKAAALSRVLDVENATSALVFCRTRTEVDHLTEKLTARGCRAEALHGGMSQEQRTRVIKRLKAGTADLVVATDVAARGLDIEQLSHVVNFDVPSSSEAYVHRIGRVGRAGREGVAITLVEPREHRLLHQFEKAARQKIEIAPVPTVADLRTKQLEMTRAALREALLAGGLDKFRPVIEALAEEFDPVEVALAATKLAHQATVQETHDGDEIPPPPTFERRGRFESGGPDAGPGKRFDKQGFGKGRPARGGPNIPASGYAGPMARLFIGAGRQDGIRPQDLVGAIAGESGINGRDIGAITIAERFAIVEVPEEAVDDVIDAMRRTSLKGKKVKVRLDEREGFSRRR